MKQSLSMPVLLFFPQARNIQNRPVVNLDPQVHRLQEMQEEIEALREELVRTRLTSKPSSVQTAHTTDSSTMMEVGSNLI